MTKGRICSRGKGHGEVPNNRNCEGCVEELKHAQDPATMTGEERAAELDSWTHIAEVNFHLIHERIEALVGRPVFTHEMGSTGLKYLLAEARTWKHPMNPLGHALDVLHEAAPNAKVIVVET